jgi:FkbM family methyltransferase
MWRQLAGRILRRFDIKLVPYSGTYVARRNALLRSSHVDTLLDIGANVGQYGTLVRHYGYAGRILSIEPLSGTFKRLAARAAGDPAWQTERRAVGAAPGTLDIHVSDDTVWSSALPLLDAAGDWNPRSRYVTTEQVEMESVDGIVARHGFATDRMGLKIDVQGFERDVLLGASETLRSVPYLEMELSGRPFYDGQMLLPEALATTADAGLTLVLVEPLRPDPATGRAMQFDGIFVRA